MAQTQSTSGTVAGYFENLSDAQQAVQALQEAGFSSAHLGVASRGANTSAAGSTASATASKVGNVAHEAGEKTAGVWNKVKNFFEGGDVEPYSDERTQGDLATREITPDPADSSNYSYGNQDLHQNLTGMAVPEDRSRYLGSRFGSSKDGAIVTVNAGSRVDEVEQILTRFGGDLGQNSGSYDYSKTEDTANVEGTQNIQLLGEMLRVHKDRVSRGEVSIRKETITETQTVQVPVTREELVIERRAVDGNTPVDGTIGDNSTIRIPLTEETASVDKSTVVREEVSVGKKSIQEVRDLSGDIRHEELVVDDNTTEKTGKFNR